MTIVYNIFYNLAKVVAYVFFSYRVIHRERLPEDGPLILAVNHMSFFDPPLAGICSRRAVYYLARKSLLEWPFFGPLFPAMNVIPVDRDGNDMAALKTVIRVIKQGSGVILFPEGTRSKDGHLQPAQAGIGFVIAKTGAPVVPMRIFGSFEAFPKNAKFPRRTPVTTVIGDPIHFTADDIPDHSRETYQKLSDRVMDAIASLQIESAK
jgi:1-acyl-sn-glycerol-3-phosphate acyltransferase